MEQFAWGFGVGVLVASLGLGALALILLGKHTSPAALPPPVDTSKIDNQAQKTKEQVNAASPSELENLAGKVLGPHNNYPHD